MLSSFQLGVVLSFGLGDLLVLGAYSGRNVQAAGTRHYGHRKFMAHIVGSLACLLLGMIALLAYSLKFDGVASGAAVGQGIAVVGLASLLALPMSRYTSGFKGFNVVGYALYALGWMASGLAVLAEPGVQTVYCCFVLTHAYLTCRVLVSGFAFLWKWSTGRALDYNVNYSVATNIAAMIPLVLAWRMTGFIIYALITAAALALHGLGISSPWHAHYRQPRHIRPSPTGDADVELRGEKRAAVPLRSPELVLPKVG